MPESMRAARLLECGSELQVQEISIPDIGANDVLVRIAACGTQDGDYMLMQGKLPLNLLPLTIGHEPAGMVAQVGAGVRGVK
ncbi:alcohol dehydrogenase, partial [Enterococcus hirae]